METTGIIRKIDDLGRIVLPKELRTVMNINSGDDFLILIEDNKLILEKYFRLKNYKEEILKLINCFVNNYDNKILLIIDNRIVNNNEVIDSKLQLIIKERKIYTNELILDNQISPNTQIKGRYVLYPIVINSDILGAIIMIGLEDCKELLKKSKLLNDLIKNIFANM